MLVQTGESWNAPIIPKAYGALNLDAVSYDLPHLEQFVIFSSVVSSTGNEGKELTHPVCVYVLVPTLKYMFAAQNFGGTAVLDEGLWLLQVRATTGMPTACATCCACPDGQPVCQLSPSHGAQSTTWDMLQRFSR